MIAYTGTVRTLVKSLYVSELVQRGGNFRHRRKTAQTSTGQLAI
jgi:hypothetical protein